MDMCKCRLKKIIGHVQLLNLLFEWNFLEVMQSILMKMKRRKCDMRCKKYDLML